MWNATVSHPMDRAWFHSSSYLQEWWLEKRGLEQQKVQLQGHKEQLEQRMAQLEQLNMELEEQNRLMLDQNGKLQVQNRQVQELGQSRAEEQVLPWGDRGRPCDGTPRQLWAVSMQGACQHAARGARGSRPVAGGGVAMPTRACYC